MKIVWQLEKATVRDVYEALREHRDVAYTTVMTMMKILEEKGSSRRRRSIAPTLPAGEARAAGRRRDGARLPRPCLRRRGRRPLLVHLAKDAKLSKVGQGRHPAADGRDRGMTMLALANLAAWILQTTILVAVALAAIRLLRLDAPAVRYHFLRALLVLCLALPFVQPRVAAGRAARPAPVAASASVRDTSSGRRRRGAMAPGAAVRCPMPR